MNMSSKYVAPCPPLVTVAPGHEGVSCSACGCHAKRWTPKPPATSLWTAINGSRPTQSHLSQRRPNSILHRRRPTGRTRDCEPVGARPPNPSRSVERCTSLCLPHSTKARGPSLPSIRARRAATALCSSGGGARSGQQSRVPRKRVVLVPLVIKFGQRAVRASIEREGRVQPVPRKHWHSR